MGGAHLLSGAGSEMTDKLLAPPEIAQQGSRDVLAELYSKRAEMERELVLLQLKEVWARVHLKLAQLQLKTLVKLAPLQLKMLALEEKLEALEQKRVRGLRKIEMLEAFGVLCGYIAKRMNLSPDASGREFDVLERIQ